MLLTFNLSEETTMNNIILTLNENNYVFGTLI